MRKLVEDLHHLDKIQKQHRDGKLTARERIGALIDGGASEGGRMVEGAVHKILRARLEFRRPFLAAMKNG